MALKPKDWTGQKKLMLTFICSTLKRRNRAVVWKAKCDCGNVIEVAPSQVAIDRVRDCGNHPKSIHDYTGKKRHMLTFVRFTGKYSVGGRVIWEAKCDCGTIIEVIPNSVRSNGILSCGCTKKPHSIKHAGKKYGMLTFIRETDQQIGRAKVWEALCDCGKTTYVVPTRAIKGNIRSCGCFGERLLAEGDLSRVYDPIISSARAVWKGYGTDCDFDTFFRLSQLPCHYCGRLPHRTWNVARGTRKRHYSEKQRINGDFTYNGLDRVDSSKGHTPDNIVPCCWTCNRMKADMPQKEFLAHIDLIRWHQSVISNTLEQTAA